jgi:hypothetical protein
MVRSVCVAYWKRISSNRVSVVMYLPTIHLLYYHYPRTGGTTIQKVLEQLFPPQLYGYGHKWNYPEIQEQTFNVVSIRHPLERIVSCYQHSNLVHKHFCSFTRWLERRFTNPFALWFPDIRFDYFIRYEYLEEDLSKLCQRYNKECENIPHYNRTANKVDWRVFYNSSNYHLAYRQIPDLLKQKYNIGENDYD